jgi:hypothetical protein
MFPNVEQERFITFDELVDDDDLWRADVSRSVDYLPPKALVFLVENLPLEAHNSYHGTFGRLLMTALIMQFEGMLRPAATIVTVKCISMSTSEERRQGLKECRRWRKLSWHRNITSLIGVSILRCTTGRCLAAVHSSRQTPLKTYVDCHGPISELTVPACAASIYLVGMGRSRDMVLGLQWR